ncbi:MAG: XRE family transcriptional regulator [Bacteroidales bacterium]|jgi:plasmid maintenance system antidote protein VapI|nr:XRE family transcriptional regulator [Bacteroidales bacterium]
MKTKPQIHIGNIIRQQLKDEGRTLVWLAKQVHCDSSNLTKLLSKDNINTDLLFRISSALNTDFFIYFSNDLFV